MLSEATGRTTPLEALGEVRALGIFRRGILTLLETGLQVGDGTSEAYKGRMFQSSLYWRLVYKSKLTAFPLNFKTLSPKFFRKFEGRNVKVLLKNKLLTRWKG